MVIEQKSFPGNQLFFENKIKFLIKFEKMKQKREFEEDLRWSSSEWAK